MKLAFLGAGKMATAIAARLVEQGVFAPDHMIAADKKAEARDAFTAATGIACTGDNATAVRQADAVLLAVKPQDAPTLLPALRDDLAGTLLITIAAGLSTTKLAGWIGSDRVIRVMPNTPAMVGLGASVYTCGAAVSTTDRKLAASILEAVGIARELPEALLDAVTGVSGSGPAYVFEFVQAMADAAVAEGIPADIALDLVVQTVAGAAEMLKQKKGSPDALRNAVTSPGGTTAAGLAVMGDADFRGLIGRVVHRATECSKELGRGA